jgi:hypothetical protein
MYARGQRPGAGNRKSYCRHNVTRRFTQSKLNSKSKLRQEKARALKKSQLRDVQLEDQVVVFMCMKALWGGWISPRN